jgi:shikimate kinase
MMGSGKTTIGRRLAEQTGWPLHDNDEIVLRLAGRTPRQILSEHGEPQLRESESRALADALSEPSPCIVGAAAGTILDPTNRALLEGSEAGVVVWLRATPPTLAARALDAEHRPWLDTGGRNWIETATTGREPLYASVADVVLGTDDRSVKAIVDELLKALARFDACRAELEG